PPSSAPNSDNMQLVAPAGNFEALRAAVINGADAVYIGMPKYGARAKADNFDLSEFERAVKFSHAYGVKIFATFNTLIKDGEMIDAVKSAAEAYRMGADAVIVQDLRFIKELKKSLPDLTLHASTQMGIHNADGAKALIDMGISRAVLSRETLPSDIPEIKKTGIDIEFFVQGALCICFSGNCYFSSLASSYSGNRGKCMQLCRKKYTFGNNTGYYLSAKDLCLYDDLNRLKELGVDAIKIEGRMRSAEYVAQSVRVYKSNMHSSVALEALKSVFNRGDYCNAYLDEGAPFRVLYPKSQANIGTHIGKIEKVSGKKLFVGGFRPSAGDGYKLMRGGIEVGGAAENNGEIIADCAVKQGDEIRRTFDGALSRELKQFDKKIDINVRVELEADKKPTVSLCCGEVKVLVEGDDKIYSATGSGITNDDIIKAFNKTADYPFYPTIESDIVGAVFTPVSSLNALRRKSYDRLYSALYSRLPVRKTQPPYALDYNKFEGNGKILAVNDLSALTPEILGKVDYVAFDPDDYGTVNQCDFSHIDKPILLNLPVTMRGGDKKVIESAISNAKIYGVISNNYYTLKLTNKPILLGTGHNIIGDCALPHITSFEADRVGNGFAYAYGYAPVMTLTHCPYGKCINCKGEDVLTDEQRRVFRFHRYKVAHCYWQLLNCVPIYHAADKLKTNNLYYDCRFLNASKIKKILDGDFSGEYTRGNMNKDLK
ncbi:MAG: U32 family peptidase, partial [Clostridiales bacterium]|nr:U32 family peptidase [Clostridiales bacterium]